MRPGDVDPDRERHALLRLVLTPGLGATSIRRGIDQMGSASTWLRRLERGGSEQGVTLVDDSEVVSCLERCRRVAVRCVGWHEVDYPAPLLELEQPPPVLFVRGDAGVLARPSVAIVGSRRATAAGRSVARTLARGLAHRGVSVVSGLALGVDGAAHMGALEGGGPTVAVLAGAVERPGPRAHSGLARQILDQGGALISEYPPGTPVRSFQFPIRNRIMAGLSRGVLVVEAREGSGTLHTVDWAQSLGRSVMVVPGPIDRPTSRGSNLLLREGASPVLELDDILDAVGLGSLEWSGVAAGPADVSNAPSPGDDDLQGRVWQALDGPAQLDEVVRRSGLTPREVLRALTQLELSGRVRRRADIGFARTD
jgi:DNA processing protein